MKKKVLIVDDNPDLICILQVQLKNKGYVTVQATNGMQAVDVATAQLRSNEDKQFRQHVTRLGERLVQIETSKA